MKKILFILVPYLLFSAVSFAGSNKHKRTNLFKELSTELRAVNQANYNTTEAFSSASFMHNGKTIRAFYDNNDGNLIAFTIPLEARELPAGTIENVLNKYKGWQIQDVLMFIDSNNNVSY